MFPFFKKQYKPDPNAPEWWQEYERATREITTSTEVNDVWFSVLDVESTALDVELDRILSFAMIPIYQEEMIPSGSFECLVRQQYFDKETVHIHELRRADIEEGIAEKEFLEKIIPMLKGTVIVGHHIGFDIAMINRALERHFNQKLCNPVVDTGQLYKKLYASRFLYSKYEKPVPTLDKLAADFGLKFHDRHSAMGDTIMTGLVFLKFIRKLRGKRKLMLKELMQ